MDDKEKLQKALDVIKEINDSFVVNGTSKHYTNISLSKKNNELVIHANKAGLLNLASQIMNLSIKGIE